MNLPFLRTRFGSSRSITVSNGCWNAGWPYFGEAIVEWLRATRLADGTRPFSRKHSGWPGRTPTHYPRLLASQPPQRNQSILASGIGDKTFGSRETGRRNTARRIVVCEQVHSDSVNLHSGKRTLWDFA